MDDRVVSPKSVNICLKKYMKKKDSSKSALAPALNNVAL